MKKKSLYFLILLIVFSSVKVYAKDDIPDALNKEWYCNIVKGNAINNYFNLPNVEEGLKINIEDYETSADFEDAIDYYNLENYRITLNFKSKNKVDIGWTSLLYNDDYEEAQHVVRKFTYQMDNNQGTFTYKDKSYPFILNNQVLTVPSQSVTCYADLVEAQKSYKLYELNEKYDKSMADEEGFIAVDGVLKKYLGTKRKLILPATIKEVASFDSDNVYYFSSLVIPKNVLKIDDSAFQYLNTDELVLEDGVVEIGAEAFLDTDFVDIYLPASITSIGANAFGSKIIEKPTFHIVRGSVVDTYLQSNYGGSDINIEYDYESSNEIITKCQEYVNYSYKEVKSFLNDGFAIRNDILYACSKQATVVQIPSGVKTIATEAFSDYYNKKVKTIIVPESVKTVENGSFSYTPAKTIIFLEGLEKIESHAFSDVYAKDIYLPKTIKKIGKNIFANEKGLNKTIFHVEKDSEIAKYLEKNPPEGDFEIAYDYEKANSIVSEEQKFNKMKFIIFGAILTSLLAIVILIRTITKSRKNEKNKALKNKKHSRRLKSLNENILSLDPIGENKDFFAETDKATNNDINVDENSNVNMNNDVTTNYPNNINDKQFTEVNSNVVINDTSNIDNNQFVGVNNAVVNTKTEGNFNKENTYEENNIDNNVETSVNYDVVKDEEIISNEDTLSQNDTETSYNYLSGSLSDNPLNANILKQIDDNAIINRDDNEKVEEKTDDIKVNEDILKEDDELI